MRAYAPAALAVVLALGTALWIERSQHGSPQEIPPALGNAEHLRSAYAEWKEAQTSAGGSRAIVLGLSWRKAFSSELVSGGGRAHLDLVAGTLDVAVQGFCAGEALDFWMIDNLPGEGRSVVPESGDRLVCLGRMAEVDGTHVLRGPIPAELVGSFELDLAVVTRAGSSPLDEGLLYGAPDLFQRLYCKEVRAARGEATAASTGLLLAMVAPVEDCASDTCSDGDLACLVEFGEKLFFNEKFNGNGRTCGTCHPAENNLTLDPEFIATLPNADPLFIAEDRPNHPFPSLVFGTPQSLGRRFENPVLMRGQALILENVDGFAPLTGIASDRFTMRGVPHVFAQRVSIRAPDAIPGDPPLPKERTGWSGDGSPFLDPALPGSNGTLRFFAAGAVRQHFTRDIRRRPGIDFRFPCDEELDAMEAFQLTLGRQADLNLGALVLLDQDAQTGKGLFVNSACNGCHAQAGAGSGPPDPSGIRVNNNFNTGVERFLTNHPDNTGEPRPPDGGFGINPDGDFTHLEANPDPTDGIFGNKEFNTPSLVEFPDTLPAFHNNITSIPGQTALANTVEGGILFYVTQEFIDSPAGQITGPIDFGDPGTGQVGKFLRVINALENKQQANDNAKRARLLLLNSTFDPATVNRLLRIAVADCTDAIGVLEPVGLHPTARREFASARQELEGAMAGTATQRRTKIDRALTDLGQAEADMKAP